MAASSITTSSQLPLISLSETVANMPTVQANSVVSSNVTASSVTSGNVLKQSLPTRPIRPFSASAVAKIIPTVAISTTGPRPLEVPGNQKPIIVTVSGMPNMGANKQLTTATNVVTTPLLSTQMIASHFTTEKIQCTSSIVTLPPTGPVVFSGPSLKSKISHLTPIIPRGFITSKSLAQIPVGVTSSTVPQVIMSSGAPVVSFSTNSAIHPTTSNQLQVVSASKGIVPFIKMPVANTSSVPLVTSSAPVGPSVVNGLNSKSNPHNPDFDPIHVMEWKDGVGALPGSDIRFKMNEFGRLEMITDENEPSVVVKTEASVSEQKPANQGHQVSEKEMSVRNGLKGSVSKRKEMYRSEATSLADPSDVSAELCRCENCDCFGLKVEFCEGGRFCSQACAAAFSSRQKSLMKGMMSKEARKRRKRKSSSSDDEEVLKNIKEKANEIIVMDEEVATKLFCWTEYLSDEKTEVMPLNCFNDGQNFPISPNGFEVGMKLEAIDPKHPSMFCVVAVAEVRGHRLRLHFDGFSERYDFWVNADSPDIFPVGWCEKTGRKLQAPKGYASQDFSWESYLNLSLKFVAAPRHLFTSTEGKNSHGFRIGMKIEAVDKKNSLLVCVATIVDIIENRLLVHFDGWDDSYDYWVDSDSSLIHPINWCDENGHDLVTPKDYKGAFSWSKYLSETKSTAASFRQVIKRQNGENSFCAGLKLEAVDKRNPRLIRVATVADKNDNSLLIHFDGWSKVYDYWVDYECLDIHPVHWCFKTGHPLEPPAGSNFRLASSQNGCPTRGCSGYGHIRGPKHTTHHSSFGCPYSHLNLNKSDTLFQERVTVSKDAFADFKPKVDHSSTTEGLRRCPTPGCNGAGHVNDKYSVHHGVSGCPLAAQQESSSEVVSRKVLSSSKSSKALDFLRNKKFKVKNKKLFATGLRGRPPKALVLLRAQQAAQQRREALKQTRLAAEIYKSVFEEPFIEADVPSSTERITKMLPNITSTNAEEIKSWTIEEVSKFVGDLTGDNEVSKIFLYQLIDGQAFILLNQDDITNILKIKLGCALKIFNSIAYFRWKLCDENKTK